MSAAVLVATLAVTVAPSASATPVCATTAGVETCQGKLANGSSYVFRMPANFKGTMFFWEHGFKSTYPYPGYTPPTGVVELTPGNSVTYVLVMESLHTTVPIKVHEDGIQLLALRCSRKLSISL
jgi:hypothetical protein